MKFLNNVFVYYKALFVSIIASAVDISIMFGLYKTSASTNMTLVISSLSGLLIQFFGQKFWTFKNSSFI